MMNKQEIYNKVRDHLLSQKIQALNEAGECAYRGKNGLKCAVGCLIQDEFYSKNMEGASLYLSAEPSPLKTSQDSLIQALEMSGILINDETLCLLQALQDIHDTHDPPTWKEQLFLLAQEYGLFP